MANATVRDDLMSPCYARAFAGGVAAILHLDDANGGDAPVGINHLPAAIFVSAAATDDLVFVDASGTTVTYTFAADFAGYMRIAPKELTADNDAEVLVLWNPEP